MRGKKKMIDLTGVQMMIKRNIVNTVFIRKNNGNSKTTVVSAREFIK